MADVASWILGILALVMFFVKPIINSFTKITGNLTDITHSLDLINKSIEQSQTDRITLHEDIKSHDQRLDAHDLHFATHDEQIKTLFNQKGDNSK